MMYKLYLLLLLFPAILHGQMSADSLSAPPKNSYKKRVLEEAEIDLLSSFYTQKGDNAAVTGGIGTEELKDFANDIHISIPLNEDDVLSVSTTISAYSSASSSNLNPFMSKNEEDENEEEDDKSLQHWSSVSGASTAGRVYGSPWIASSGASKSDVWVSPTVAYAHSSDDRNTTYGSHLSFANEFDYQSFGFGLNFSRQFNEINTEWSFETKMYLDKWFPEYPTEIKTFIKNQGDLNADFFSGVDIFDAQQNRIDKLSDDAWKPLQNTLVDNPHRNTYSLSINFSQIISGRAQFSLLSELLLQKGWLANPMQRVYFADKANYFIGNPNDIEHYTSAANTEVFQLADDIERLPHRRWKMPLAVRFHYYLNEYVVMRSYYRYYLDDWGIRSQTVNIEIPVKIAFRFTLYPSFRYYSQNASTYFAPYEQHLSTEEFYTSDYDLSAFDAQQYGLGIKYTDIFTSRHIWKFHLKNWSINYHYYRRNSSFRAHIVSVGAKFVFSP